MVQTLVVAEVMIVASELDAVAVTLKLPDVMVRAAIPAKVMTLLPCPMVRVKVCVVEAMLVSVGVKVPVIVTVPGFKTLKVVPAESAATVVSLETKTQVPATEPTTAAELTAGAAKEYVAPGAYVTLAFEIVAADAAAAAIVRV
jgi:hypothetical protein